MNRNNTFRLIVVLVLLVWSFFQIYPPVGRKLADVFQEEARGRDANYTNIIADFKKLEQRYPGRTDYANLVEAISTNDIARYFREYVNTNEELNPNRAVLSALQQKAAGKIKLGIDLQGGTSFLVEADYSKVSGNSNPPAVSATNAAAGGTNAAPPSNAALSTDEKKV